MLVNGAIIPPRAALDAVTAVVKAVPPPPEAAPEAESKGIFGRRGRHRREEEAAAEVVPALQYVADDRLNLPITGFGNLTTTDMHRVIETITEAAAELATPEVRFAGGTALDFPGDWSVWAKLDGDVEGVLAVTRGVTQCVERLGFYVDRRQFRPMLSVATVTPTTTGPYLQQVVDALEAFRGEDWRVEISLTKETFVGSRPQIVEFQRIPLTG